MGKPKTLSKLSKNVGDRCIRQNVGRQYMAAVKSIGKFKKPAETKRNRKLIRESMCHTVAPLVTSYFSLSAYSFSCRLFNAVLHIIPFFSISFSVGDSNKYFCNLVWYSNFILPSWRRCTLYISSELFFCSPPSFPKIEFAK